MLNRNFEKLAQNGISIEIKHSDLGYSRMYAVKNNERVASAFFRTNWESPDQSLERLPSTQQNSHKDFAMQKLRSLLKI
ncbi:hypothetical protein BM527_04530 [Alteromonas sp. Mex14]|nr:hypothetical protein BM527_04530 [Alteromonas sp. Mex14]